jgi:beta-glucosidase
MCSFNRLNNSYACQNSKAQNGLLKGELGFQVSGQWPFSFKIAVLTKCQGWIVSDWGAQKAGVASALGGLDVGMPSAAGRWVAYLVAAIRNGSVPESRLTDMATR